MGRLDPNLHWLGTPEQRFSTRTPGKPARRPPHLRRASSAGPRPEGAAPAPEEVPGAQCPGEPGLGAAEEAAGSTRSTPPAGSAGDSPRRLERFHAWLADLGVPRAALNGPAVQRLERRWGAEREAAALREVLEEAKRSELETAAEEAAANAELWRALEAECTGLEERNRRLEAEREQLDLELEEARDALSAQQEAAAKGRQEGWQELKEAQEAARAACVENSRLQEDNLAVTREATALRHEARALQEKLEALQGEKRSQGEKHEALRSENDFLVSEVQQLNGQIEEVQAENKAFQAELVDQGAQHKRIRDGLAGIEKLVDASRACGGDGPPERHARAQAELQRLQRAVRASETAVQELAAEKAELAEATRILAEELRGAASCTQEEHETAIEEAGSKIASLRLQNGSLREALEKSTACRGALETTVEQLLAKVARTKSACDALTADAEARFEALVQEAGEAETAAGQLRGQKAALEMRLEASTVERHRLQDALALTVAELKRREAALQSWEREARAKEARMEGELVLAKHGQRQMEQESEAAQKKAVHFRVEARVANAALETASAENSELRTTLGKLKEIGQVSLEAGLVAPAMREREVPVQSTAVQTSPALPPPPASEGPPTALVGAHEDEGEGAPAPTGPTEPPLPPGGSGEEAKLQPLAAREAEAPVPTVRFVHPAGGDPSPVVAAHAHEALAPPGVQTVVDAEVDGEEPQEHGAREGLSMREEPARAPATAEKRAGDRESPTGTPAQARGPPDREGCTRGNGGGREMTDPLEVEDGPEESAPAPEPSPLVGWGATRPRTDAVSEPATTPAAESKGAATPSTATPGPRPFEPIPLDSPDVFDAALAEIRARARRKAGRRYLRGAGGVLAQDAEYLRRVKALGMRLSPLVGKSRSKQR